MRGRRLLLMTTALLLLALVCAFGAGTASAGVTVSGNRLVDTTTGRAVRLLGANRYALASSCTSGGTNDGPTDTASVAAMAAWQMTAVRLPVNQDCWLGRAGLPTGETAVAYQTRVLTYARDLEAAGLIVILDNQFGSVPGSNSDHSLPPLPDQNAPLFLKDLATRFGGDRSVVFDVFNEPHPDPSSGDGVVGSTPPWQCWRDGCTVRYTSAGSAVTYAGIGMQALVDAIRSTGNTQPVLLSGVAYGSDLSQWLAFRPTDDAGQLVASVHLYEYRDNADPDVWVGAEGRPHVTGETPAQAALRRTAAWDAALAPVAQQVPLVAGEVGEYDCNHDFSDQFFDWADLHGAGYLGWTWNAVDGQYWFCDGFGRGGPSLVSSYDGTPTAYGQGLHDRLALDAAPDDTPPDIAITAPAGGQAVPQGAVVQTTFTCTDAGRGVSSCSGPPTLDTAAGGPHSFTVTATDKAGNATSASVAYVVTVPPPVTTPGPALTPTGPPPRAAVVSLAAPPSLSTTARGVFSVPVRCAVAAPCSGHLTALLPLPATKTGRATTLTLARVAYALKAGRSGRVAVGLNPTGRVRLKRALGRLKVRIVLTPSRAAERPAARTVTLRRR